MTKSFETFPLPAETVNGIALFDANNLANHIGVSVKSLWYCVLASDKEKYHQFHIRKKNGTIRTLHAPNPAVKFIQKRLNKNLLNLLQDKLPEYVTAYRPNHNIPEAVKRHVATCPICDSAEQTPPKHNCPRKGAYIQMDLTNFFHNTKRRWVGNVLEKNLGLPNAVAGPIRDIVTVRDIPCFKRGSKRYGVPQGAPTSGSICNLVAYYRLDLPICEYLAELNTHYSLKDERVWVYSRYADDLAFTCGRDFPFTEKVQIVRDLIHHIEQTGYTVNRYKVHIRSSHRNKDLLGLNFNDRITISRTEYLRLRAIVHNSLVYGLETQYERAGFKTPMELLHWLRGKVQYVKYVDPAKGTNLHRELLGAIHNYQTLYDSQNRPSR